MTQMRNPPPTDSVKPPAPPVPPPAGSSTKQHKRPVLLMAELRGRLMLARANVEALKQPGVPHHLFVQACETVAELEAAIYALDAFYFLERDMVEGVKERRT